MNSIPDSINAILDSQFAKPVAVDAVRPSSEMLSRHKLDWTVSKQPVEVDGKVVSGYAAVVRDDTREVLGIVASGYMPVQNKDAFSAFDAILQNGHGKYRRVGSFRNGTTVWLEVVLNEQKAVVVGDEVRSTLVLANGHDGSCAYRVARITERLVCTNGLVRKSSSKVFSLRHTGQVGARVQWANNLVKKVAEEANKDVEVFRALAKRQMVTAQIVDYLRAAVPDPVDIEAKRAKANAEKIRDEILGLLESGRGTEIQGVRGTLWGAYNAVTEWVDHHRHSGHEESRRVESNWFGQGAEIKSTALEEAIRRA